MRSEEAELDLLDRLGREPEPRRRPRRLDGPAEQLRQAREVRLQHVEHPRRVESRRRMEERVEDDPQAAEHHLLLLPVDTRDPERLARQELRREVAERDNDLRPDQLDLVEEMAFARLDLLRERIAVPRR